VMAIIQYLVDFIIYGEVGALAELDYVYHGFLDTALELWLALYKRPIKKYRGASDKRQGAKAPC
jgi:hypothetical protein